MSSVARRIKTAFPNGTCRACGKAVPKGTDVIWVKGTVGAKGRVYHVECYPVETAPDHDAAATVTGSAAPSALPQTVIADLGPELGTLTVSTVDQCGATASPPGDQCGTDDALDALGVLPYLERHGITAGPACTIEHETVTHNVVEVTRRTGEVTSVPNAHPMFARLAQLALEGERCVYIYGPSGTGKTHAAHALAAALGRPFYIGSLSPQSMPALLLGYMDAQSRYCSTDFRRAYETPSVYCQDEMDNANGALLASLNSAFANGRAAFPDAAVERSGEHIMLATGNTPGFGPTPTYGERRPLDRAFRDRFTFLFWDYDTAHELAVAKSLTDNAELAETWAAWVHAVRAYCATEYRALEVSPRAIYSALPLFAFMPVVDVAESVLFKGIEAGVKAKIIKSCPYPAIQVSA